MTTSDDDPLSGPLVPLDEETCWLRLRAHSFGRLAVTSNDPSGGSRGGARGRPTILPVNYAVDGHSLLFRTSGGTKLQTAHRRGYAAFEIDEIHPHQRTGWSVVVHGRLSEIEGFEEVRRAQELAAVPFADGDRHHYVRLSPSEVSGFEVAVPASRRPTQDDAPAVGHVWFGLDASDLLG